MKLKDKIYKVVVRRVGQSKTLISKKNMLWRWIRGHTKSDKIRKEDIWNKVGVTSVMNKMKEERL